MMIFKANLVKYMSYDSKALIKSTFSLKDFKRRWESNKAQKKYFNLLSYLSLEKSKNELRLLCSKQINLFRYICSEEDSLYGMSYIPETYDLIARSNLLNVFRQRADGLSCLRKFRRIYEYREKTNLDLKRIFEYLFEKKKYEVNSREGEVFSLGALKEFLNKGITGLYEKKKTTKKVVVEAIKKTPIIVKKLSGNDVKQIIKKRTKKLSRNKKQKKNMIRIKRTSAFEDAFISLKRSGQKNIMINMDKFKYDLLFTLKLKRVLDEVLKPYLKRSSLMRMKNDDKLGTKDGPVPLTFLKYMIETAKHKELYSLIHLIGEKFIVVDDLNRKKRVHNYMISLINSKKTNFKWQIQLWR
ncbi:MAG: hypothetical protein N4A33_06605 [Bacteriovoracaceae bacterium]|nr:hypothetical protein [Bacteriovoracaceae bacterium]